MIRALSTLSNVEGQVVKYATTVHQANPTAKLLCLKMDPAMWQGMGLCFSYPEIPIKDVVSSCSMMLQRTVSGSMALQQPGSITNKGQINVPVLGY